ncbi:NUDIX domain-containing protein, partial [Candidatus Nomurabacteria bacterium]|nr:NUDIX domain-containing protein [Candidatus Nomurabacteria bacterium]
MNKEHMHPRIGVYGIFFNQGKILLIKKSRGPYKGKYDLPGGGIEYSEKIEDALKREIYEETGASMISCTFFNVNENYCKYINNDNKILEIHQIGLYYLVSLDFKNLKTYGDDQDS